MAEATAESGRGRGRGGFTLVEVIVSMVVVTVGLLGLAQLHWFSQRSSTISLQRTLAHVQALDMGERMWGDLPSPLDVVEGWKESHEESLPGWKGTVTSLSTSDGLYRIRIEWNEPGAPEPPEYEYLVRIPVVTP